MTGPYEWNPMPHVVDVVCTACARHAVFEFAEVARIALRRDVALFQSHPLFEYRLCQDSLGNKWHAAFFFHGLHVRDTGALRDLPDGYAPSDWDHSKYLVRSHGTDWGTVVCSNCGLRRRHRLEWPKDAWFQFDYRSTVLWAFNRESALELRDFIASDQRDRSKYRWESFLSHVPKEFLARGARADVVELLDRLLSA